VAQILFCDKLVIEKPRLSAKTVGRLSLLGIPPPDTTIRSMTGQIGCCCVCSEDGYGRHVQVIQQAASAEERVTLSAL